LNGELVNCKSLCTSLRSRKTLESPVDLFKINRIGFIDSFTKRSKESE